MIYQLPHPVGVYVTSKQMEGRAIGWIDYGSEISLMWIIILENQEIWVVKTEEVRALKNFSMDYVHE